MPIDIAEFEKGEAEDSIEAKAEKFLVANRGKAYSTEEIGRAISYWRDYTGRSDVKILDYFQEAKLQGHLQRIEAEGRIRSRVVRTGGYLEVFWAAK